MSAEGGRKRSREGSDDGSRKRQHGDEGGASPSPSVSSNQQERIKRERRDRYEIVNTRGAITDKTGSSGEPIRLKANYFELKQCPDFIMLMYRVDFYPECLEERVRKYLMYTQRQLLGAYLYDSQNMVYLTHKLPTDTTTVEISDKNGVTYQLTIKNPKEVSMDTRESLQVLNIILRRAMEGLKLQLVGRNLFDPLGKVDFKKYHIQLWPGYTTSIRQHERAILLSAEVANKVMRDETIYDILDSCFDNGDFQQTFQEAVLGKIVLTDYNNKTYRIDEVDFLKSPMDTFETKNGPKSFVDYYQEKYSITIKNKTQPMLVSRAKDRQRRGGENELILLIPELCRPTGLTDNQRKDFDLMKDMATHTRMDPRNRINALQKLNRRLQETPESQNILKAWNLQLHRDLVQLNGRKLKNENIYYGQGAKEPTNQFADWQMAFRDKSMYLSYPLQNWCVVVTGRMRQNISQFMSNIFRASSQMGFEVLQPEYVEINNDSTQSYLQGFKIAADSNPQLVMIFVPNNNADKYSSVKKLATCSYGIPTQVIVQKTLNNRQLLSIATKVAIQLNCKLGGTPWLVDIPTRGLMTVGIDISKDTMDKKKYWGALVASMDLKSLDKESFFSCVSGFRSVDEYSAQLCLDIVKSVKQFHKNQQAFPQKILIFREGVGDGQLKFIYDTELTLIKNKLEEIYAQIGQELKMAYVVTSKKIQTRIFGSNENNPPPGTIVDDVITLPESQDFLLCAQSVRQGTVSPTRYNVLYSNIGLTPDRLQQLTYKQCHLYFNWAGTTRVPAVCQNAHKLSYLVGQFLHQIPNQTLEKKLYFL